MFGIKKKVKTELEKLVEYADKNDIAVKFVDSKELKDYAGMNPEAAETMGYPDYDGDKQTKEIEIDRSLPEQTQVRNLKHELIEYRLMKRGMEYWDAHEKALTKEKEPFDYKPMKSIKAKLPENNTVSVEQPKRRYKVNRYHRQSSEVNNQSVSNIRR